MEKYFLYEAAFSFITDKWYDKIEKEVKVYHEKDIEKQKDKLLEVLDEEHAEALKSLIHFYSLYEEELRYVLGKYIFYYSFSMGLEFQEAFDKFYE